MPDATVCIVLDSPGAVIRPTLYGHSAEHVGRCVYEGLWVGPDSRIPNHEGLRLDVLAAMKQLRTPLMRWPGGRFAETYHWRDGIGPASARPQTVNMWWHQTEPNAFGTDEFMCFCAEAGCAPYLTLNLGTGTPREALAWLEYCNFAGDSSLARQRAANVAPEPYDVRLWSVGHEPWASGGRLTPTEYATEYIRYASFLRTLDPEIELVASGAPAFDPRNSHLAMWNRDFCRSMAHPDLIDHLSIHRHFTQGPGAGFSDDEFRALFVDLLLLERDIQQADRLLSLSYPEKNVGLAIDEWGLWHPEANGENGLEQANTLRDAVFAGACLNLFNQYAHRVSSANLAQSINVLQCLALTQGAHMCLTPTYHIFDMMRPHMGARLVHHDLECPSFEAQSPAQPSTVTVPCLSVSVSESGRKLLATIANQTLDRPIEARLSLASGKKAGPRIAGAHARLLHGDDPRAVNTFAEPKRVSPKRLKLEPSSESLDLLLPPHSFTALALAIE